MSATILMLNTVLKSAATNVVHNACVLGTSLHTDQQFSPEPVLLTLGHKQPMHTAQADNGELPGCVCSMLQTSI